VGEHLVAGHVADRVDALLARFERSSILDEARSVSLHAELL
jgi:hypothetical protein